MMQLSRLYDVNWRKFQHTAFLFLTSLDTQLRPAQLVASVAMVFMAVCKRWDLDPRRVMEVVERIERAAHDGHGSVELRAIHRYLKEEITSDG